MSSATTDNGVSTVTPVIGVRQIMSEAVDIQAKPKTARDSSNDRRVLAQVEKWMAMIREISREPMKS